MGTATGNDSPVDPRKEKRTLKKAETKEKPHTAGKRQNACGSMEQLPEYRRKMKMQVGGGHPYPIPGFNSKIEVKNGVRDG